MLYPSHPENLSPVWASVGKDPLCCGLPYYSYHSKVQMYTFHPLTLGGVVNCLQYDPLCSPSIYLSIISASSSYIVLTGGEASTGPGVLGTNTSVSIFNSLYVFISKSLVSIQFVHALCSYASLELFSCWSHTHTYHI